MASPDGQTDKQRPRKLRMGGFSQVFSGRASSTRGPSPNKNQDHRVRHESVCEYNQLTGGAGIWLTVRNIEVTRIARINEADNSFDAQIFVQLAFPPKNVLNEVTRKLKSSGEAQYKNLPDDIYEQLIRVPDRDAKDSDTQTSLSTPYFPLADDGKHLKSGEMPNAAWYLHQLIFENLDLSPNKQREERDQLVRIDPESGEILLEIYAEGTFFELFELRNFPFDSQDLTFALTLNAQVNGKFGCKIYDYDSLPRETLLVPLYGTELKPTVASVYLKGHMMLQNWSIDEYIVVRDKEKDRETGHNPCVRIMTGESSSHFKDYEEKELDKKNKKELGESSESLRASVPSSPLDWIPLSPTKRFRTSRRDSWKKPKTWAAQPRQFATAYISVKVTRQTGYFFQNVMLPTALFVPFGLSS